ncbi:DUF4177 domain-containing protein [Nonomuraea sp. NPDC001684]
MARRWEYKIATLKDPEVEKQLNELGQQGWELVHMKYQSAEAFGRTFTCWYWCVFKRHGIS